MRILESEEDFEPIPRRALGVTGIMVTHGHWDHIRALRELESLTDAITYAGSADAEAIRAQENFTVENELNGGEVFDFYDTELQVRAISVPGHTPGSIVYSVQTTWEDGSPATLLFTGDALFPGGVGKTDSPAQFGELFSNVLEKLFGNFDDEAIVLPGHGRSTTLGTERPHLYFWVSGCCYHFKSFRIFLTNFFLKKHDRATIARSFYDTRGYLSLTQTQATRGQFMKPSIT